VNLKNQFTTIFFDLFGVLLGADQSVVVQYLSQLTEAPYLEIREIAMGEPFMRLERREINFTQYVDEIRTSVPNGSRIEEGPLRNIWMNSGVDEMPAVSLIENLLIDYGVWIISNTTESHINSLQSKFAFLSLVGGIITSERAGSYKPNQEIFHFALSEANTDAASSIFIDDSYINVGSAENLGFTAHHYVDYQKLEDCLNQILGV
jgi:HAD superfamily hydrolase (TIGR01509 family)